MLFVFSDDCSDEDDYMNMANKTQRKPVQAQQIQQETTTDTYINSEDARGSRVFYPPLRSVIDQTQYDQILAGDFKNEFQVPTMPQQREQSYFATINSLANLQINFFDKHTPPTRHRSKEDIVAGYFQTYGLLPPHINGWPLPPFTPTINSPKFPPHIERYLTFPPDLEHFTL